MNHGMYAELIRVNLDKTTPEIAKSLGLTFGQVKYIQKKYNIWRTPEQIKQIITSKNNRARGSKNGNWKGGISVNSYHYKKKSVEKHRAKHIARRRFEYAYRTGKIERKPCEICGDPQSEGHHTDYSQPLNVKWLCRFHHLQEHKKNQSNIR